MILPYISGPSEISNEAYHHSPLYLDYLSSSGLKNYQISPKYARYAQLNPTDKSTPAMIEGTMYHDLLESYVNYGDNRAFPWISFNNPPINSKTGNPYGNDTQTYQYALMEFQHANPGKKIGPVNFITNVRDMVGGLLYGDPDLSPDIKKLIKDGKAEQSHFLEHQGGLWKYRTDLKTAKKIIDWKKTTLENPKVENFPSQIIEYGYHISAAMYQYFEFILTGVWKKFFWVVQENEAPYDFMILDASEWTWGDTSDPEAIVPKIGGQVFLKLMEQRLWCLENNQYPGYSVFIKPDWKGHRIGVPEVPGWFLKQNDFNFFNPITHDRTEIGE